MKNHEDHINCMTMNLMEKGAVPVVEGVLFCHDPQNSKSQWQIVEIFDNFAFKITTNHRSKMTVFSKS